MKEVNVIGIEKNGLLHFQVTNSKEFKHIAEVSAFLICAGIVLLENADKQSQT